MSDNYYDILEVEKTATDKEISKQYKKLALKYHPDKNQGNAEAAEKFKTITEAYQVLSDDKKKKMYDQFGKDGMEQGGINPEELFAQMFAQQREQAENDVPDAECILDLTFEQLYNGCTIKQEIERISLCATCHGYGTKNATPHEVCIGCSGSGRKVTMMRPGMLMQTECGGCGGSGKKTDKGNECRKCHGTQFIKEFIDIEVTVPAGSHEDHQIYVKEEGHAVPVEDAYKLGKKRSDALFHVREKPHKTFKRFLIGEKGELDMADLGVEMDISLCESLLGFNKSIMHLNGKQFDVCSPNPTKHASIIVFKGHGMPRLDDGDDENKFGDLFVTINVDYPASFEFTKEEKESLSKIFKTPIPKMNKNYTKNISIDKYKSELQKQQQSDNMKQKYNKRKQSGHGGHGGHGGQGGPNIQQNCQQM
jgi:DnaJ-class molecular chaperone